MKMMMVGYDVWQRSSLNGMALHGSIIRRTIESKSRWFDVML